jgi:hypothetical protein
MSWYGEIKMKPERFGQKPDTMPASPGPQKEALIRREIAKLLRNI